ncbi:hypothetical protein [Aurantivibrio infirmus]
MKRETSKQIYRHYLRCLLVFMVLAGNAGNIKAQNDISNAACNRGLTNYVSALINRAPLILADFKIGTDGSSDPSLASALAVSNTPRETIDNLEYPSELEVKIGESLHDDPCFQVYGRIIRQGEQESSGKSRAILQMQMPFAKMDTLAVEYLEGQFRRNYFFQATFSFELRDGKGRVVFAKSSANNYRRTCFWNLPQTDCLDLQNNPVNPDDAWRLVIASGINSLLNEVAIELVAWHDMLEEQSGDFYDRRYSQDIELDGRQVRTREQLALPYLFVQSPQPRININGLLAGLSERKFLTEEHKRDDFQNYFNVLFRSELDKALRLTIEKHQALENTRIMLLSDTNSAAFQNAMMIACAEMGRGFNSEDCLEPVKLIENLCSEEPKAASSERAKINDQCLLSSLSFGRSLTRANDESLDKLRDAQQRIQMASHLRLPEERDNKETVKCINLETEEISGHLVGVSENYYRVDNENENDDGYYLMDAAHKVVELQSHCLADEIVNRYQDQLSKD